MRVGLSTKEEVETHYKDIIACAKAYKEDAEITGVLVQQMAGSGNEVILGMKRDPQFGPLVMFGLGGIFVELFKDVVFRVAPFGRNTARRMVKNIRAYPMLTGFRGNPHADVEEIEKCLVRLSQLVSDHPEIRELDVNPLRVHPDGKGATVADIVMRIREVDDENP